MIVIAIPSAPSGSRTSRPRNTPAQVTANAISHSRPNASTVSSAVPCGLQPTIRPQRATTAVPAISSAISAIVRPAMTELRAIGRVLSRSMRPDLMSDATPTAMPGSVPIIDCAKMPETR